jgi:ribosome-associated protein
MPCEIAISGTTIRLGQLLKLAGIVESGSAVKILLAAETVTVNGERETRRGRQVRPGDHVRVGERELRVIAAPPPAQPA